MSVAAAFFVPRPGSSSLLRSAQCLFLLCALPMVAASGQANRTAAASTSATARWVGTWAAAPIAVPNAAGTVAGKEQLYQTVHVSRGGASVRVTLTNELGTDPLTVDGARLALRGRDTQPLPGSERPLTFAGQSATVIPAGAVAVSDPVALPLAPSSDLEINLSLPAQPQHTVTAHLLGLQTNFLANGESLTSTPPGGARPLMQWQYLKNVEVAEPAGHGAAIVTVGDSITDGNRSTPDTNRRWPDVLARRLQADPGMRGLSVLNEGISGNRVLHDGTGPNALARFDRDVLSQDGVRYLIVMEGINDIGRTAQPRNPDDGVTLEAILAGLTQLIERAHAHGILVYGATLTPYLGAGYASPAGEMMRQAVNTWIRTGGRFDGVIDFDKITGDPADPGHLLPTFDSGDHLHPSDAGYRAMADGIDLHLFTQP